MYDCELTADEKSRRTGDTVNYTLICEGCGTKFDADFDEIEGAECLYDVSCPECQYINVYDLDAEGEVIWPPKPETE